MTRDDVTEETPLVGDRDGATRPASSQADSLVSLTVPKVHTPQAVTLLFVGLVLLASAAGGLLVIPLTRMVEDIVCRQHYGFTDEGGDIDESLCKIEAVQSRLAFIFAVYGTIQALICELSTCFRLEFETNLQQPASGHSPGVSWRIGEDRPCPQKTLQAEF